MTRKRTSIRYFLVALLFVVLVASLALTACNSGKRTITWQIDEHATVTVEGEKKLPQKAKDGATIVFTIKTDDGYVVDEVLRDNRPVNANSAGKYSITIAADVTIKVTTKKEISDIEVTTKPNKLTYFAGERLDKTGMVVKLKYATGDSEAITDYSIRYQTSSASSFQLGDKWFKVYVGDSVSEPVRLDKTVAALITIDPLGGTIDEGYVSALEENEALSEVNLDEESGVLTFQYTEALTENVALPTMVQMSKGKEVGDYDFKYWSCDKDAGKGEDDVYIVKDGALTKETVTSVTITANWDAHLADITNVAYDVVDGVPYLVIEGTYRAATSLSTYLTEGNKDLAYLFNNKIQGTRGESFELRANMLDFVKDITSESGLLGSWLDIRVAQEVNGVIEHTEAPQDRSFEKYSVTDGKGEYNFAFETWEGWRKVVVTVVMPFTYTMSVDNTDDVLTLTIDGQIKDHLIDTYVGATVVLDWWMGAAIGPDEVTVDAQGKWQIVYELSPEKGFILDTVGYAHIKILAANGDVLYKDGEPGKDGNLLASGLTNRNEFDQIAVPNGEIVGNNNTIDSLEISNSKGTLVYYPCIAWWESIVIYGIDPTAPKFSVSGDVELAIDNYAEPTKVYYVVKLTVEKNLTEDQVFAILFGNNDGTKELFESDRTISKINGNVYTLYFDVTAYSGTRLWSNLYMPVTVGEGDDATTQYEKLAEIKDGSHKSNGKYAIVNGIKYSIECTGDNGTWGSPCLKTETAGADETNPPELNPDYVAPEYTPTDVELKVEGESVYFILSGTYAGYTEAQIKDILDNVYLDLQKNPYYLTGSWSGDWQEYPPQERVVVVNADGTWSISIEITALPTFAYTTHIGRVPDPEKDDGSTKPGDLKITDTSSDGRNVTLNGRIYTIHNKYGVKGDEGKLFWGNIGLVITEIDAPEYAVTGATLEATTDKVYFVISGTHENYEEEALEAILDKVYFDLQWPVNPWTRVKDLARVVSIDMSAGTWTIKFDVTEVPAYTKPYTVHFGGEEVNLKLEADQATDGYDVTLNNVIYTMGNKPGLDGADNNYGAVSLKVEQIGAPEITLDGSTFDLAEDGGKAYVVINITAKNFANTDAIKESIMYGNVEGQWSWKTPCVKVDEIEGGYKLWFEISEIDVGSGGKLFSNLFFGDAKMEIKDSAHTAHGHNITVGDIKYSIECSGDTWDILCIKIEDVSVPEYTTSEVDIVNDEETVYLVIKGSYVDNGNPNAASKLEAVLEKVAFDLEHNAAAGAAGWLGKIYDFDRIATVADGNWELKIDITSLKYSAYTAHFNGGNLECSNAAIDGKSVIVNGTSYTIVNKPGASEGNEFWGAIGIRVADADIANYAKLTATGATLESNDGKVYLVISGSYTEIEDADIERVLNKVYFDLQHNEQAGGKGWDDVTGFARTVTGSNGSWQIKIDISNLERSAYTAHFNIKATGGREDLKISDTSNDGTKVTLGENLFTMINKHGSGEGTEFWGCIGIRVSEAGATEYTVTSTELKEEDGKAVLVIKGTVENYREGTPVYVATVRNGGLAGDNNWDTVVRTVTIVVDEGGNFTATWDLTEMGLTLGTQYYFHFGAPGKDLPANTVINATEDTVEITVGEYRYILVGCKDAGANSPQIRIEAVTE